MTIAVPFGRCAVEDRIVVGWMAPSAAWGRAVALQELDAARAETLGPGRREAFLTGRALLARLLTDLFPGSAAWSVDTAPCPGCGAGRGPAMVRGAPALVSVAHADGLVVAAVAPVGAVTRLGVDVASGDAGPARSQAERPGAVEAVVTQAVAKAGGHGLRLAPGELRFGPGTARVEGVSTTYLVRAVDGPPGWVLRVAWQQGLRAPRA